MTATAVKATSSGTHTGEPAMVSTHRSAVLRRRVIAIARGTAGRSSSMTLATSPGMPMSATVSSSLMPSSMRSAMASA